MPWATWARSARPRTAARTPGPRPRPRSRCRGPGRRSRTASAAVPRTRRSWSCQLFCEPLSPRRIPELPAEHPLGLGVGEAASLGHHAHRHLAGHQPGQPPGDPARRLRSGARREVRQPLADRSRLVIDDVEHAGHLLFHREDGGARCVLDVHPGEVTSALTDEREQPSPHHPDLVVVGARPVEPAVPQTAPPASTTVSSRRLIAFVPSITSSGSSSVLTHPPVRTPFMLAWPCMTTWDTPIASAAASRWSTPSLRRRLVIAKNRSARLRSGLPECASDRAVIWFTIVSGRAAATASPTAAASSPSMTMPSAPRSANSRSLSALVVVAVTSCPFATSCGTRNRPMTPLPPATNTRIA